MTVAKRKKVVEGYPPGTKCFVLEITYALLLLKPIGQMSTMAYIIKKGTGKYGLCMPEKREVATDEP